ncbi:MAG: hypothetical protein ACYDHX_11690 [Methanothrix sp.]
MKTKAKCILVMVAICILITPAFSQGDDRAGRNGNQMNEMGPAHDNGMGLGPQDDGIGQDQAPIEPKFKGCNTWLQEMKDKKPIKEPFSNTPNGLENGNGAQDGQGDKLMPWQHVEQDDERDGSAIYGYSSKGKHAPSKSIMAHNSLKGHPKKSLMEKRHRKAPRPLMGINIPEMPPMKSIMNHWE